MSLLKDAKILVVDDDSTLRGAVRFELEMAGAVVEEASSGRSAFERVRKVNFHLILSDVRMPDGDGFELLDKVYKLNSNLPVVLFISDLAGVSKEDMQSRGCAAHLSKPFDPEFLVKVLSDTIKKYYGDSLAR